MSDMQGNRRTADKYSRLNCAISGRSFGYATFRISSCILFQREGEEVSDFRIVVASLAANCGEENLRQAFGCQYAFQLTEIIERAVVQDRFHKQFIAYTSLLLFWRIPEERAVLINELFPIVFHGCIIPFPAALERKIITNLPERAHTFK